MTPSAGPRRRLVLGGLAGLLAVIVLAVLVGAGWAPLRRFDLAVADGLNGFAGERPWLVTMLNAVALAFHPWAFRIGVLVLVVVLLRRRVPRLAWWAGVTMAASSLLGPVIQLPLSRARPTFDAPVATLAGYSFPSLHAFNSTVGIVILLVVLAPALAGRRARVAAWFAGGLAVLLVGFDRVALGVHYVSDVLAGWSCAAALLAATIVALPPRPARPDERTAVGVPGFPAGTDA